MSLLYTHIHRREDYPHGREGMDIIQLQESYRNRQKQTEKEIRLQNLVMNITLHTQFQYRHTQRERKRKDLIYNKVMGWSMYKSKTNRQPGRKHRERT